MWCNNLINDILDISKVEARKMELHIDSLNVATVTNEIVAMYFEIQYPVNKIFGGK